MDENKKSNKIQSTKSNELVTVAESPVAAEALQRAIDYFGNVFRLSNSVGFKRNGNFYDILSSKKRIGPLIALKVEAATKGYVKRHELCPNYDWSLVPPTDWSSINEKGEQTHMYYTTLEHDGVKKAFNRAVEYFGSVTGLSRALQYESCSRVSQVIHGKTKVGPLLALKIEALTKGHVTRQELCPDYDWLIFPPFDWSKSEC